MMDLYLVLSYLIVLTGFFTGTFMAHRAWKYRRDGVLMLCLLLMMLVNYATGTIFLISVLGVIPPAQVLPLTIGSYMRPVTPLLLILPCVLLEIKRI